MQDFVTRSEVQTLLAPQPPSDGELEIRYSYHPPRNDQPDRYDLLRKQFGALARSLVRNTPASYEQQEALKHLEMACMYGNASIARRE